MKDNLLILILIVIGVGWLAMNTDRPQTAVTTQPVPVIERIETIVETVQVIVTAPPVVLEPVYEPTQPVATVAVMSVNSVVMIATPTPTSTAVGLEERLIQAGALRVAECVREGANNAWTPGYQIDKDLFLCQACVLGTTGKEPFILRPVDLMLDSEEGDDGDPD